MSGYDYSSTNLSKLETENGLPAGMLSSLIYAENSSDSAVSPKGAVGTMQNMPATAANPGYGVPPYDPKDPAGTAKYVKALYDRSWKDPTLTAAAYNAGLGGDYTNSETAKYIDRFNSHYRKTNVPQDQPQSQPVVAELADGRRLEFPAGTSPDIVQKTVKNVLSKGAAPAAPATGAPTPAAPLVGPPKGAKPLDWQQQNQFKQAIELYKQNPQKAYQQAKLAPEFVPDVPGSSEAFGALGKALGIGEKAATPLQQQAQNAQKMGFKLPPSQARPGGLTERLEGFGNVAKLERDVSAANQPVIQEMVAKDLGLPPGMQVTEDSVNDLIDKAGNAYEALKSSGVKLNTSPLQNGYQQQVADLAKDWRQASKEFPNLANPKIDKLIDSMSKMGQTKAGQTFYEKINIRSAVDFVKQMRNEAKVNFRATDAKTVALARAQMDAANIMDNLIDTNLKAQGQNFQLYSDYTKARQTIAKSIDALNAMNKSTGNISGSYLAKLLNKGKPLSGGMRDIAEIASAFPKSVQSVEKMGAQPRASAVDMMTTMLRNPALAAAMASRPAVRSLLMSRLFQGDAIESIGDISSKALQETGRVAGETYGTDQ